MANESGNYLKQIVQLSTPVAGRKTRNVVVREQMFNHLGMAIGEPRVGTIQYDPEKTTAEEVLKYAKTRKWAFGDIPNRIGQFELADIGPAETEAHSLGTGINRRSDTLVAENELVVEGSTAGVSPSNVAPANAPAAAR